MLPDHQQKEREKSKEKLKKTSIIPMTEEEKYELELNSLAEIPFHANPRGKSLDNIINFQSKTPEKWMEKWKKNLIINPKYISSVVGNEATKQFSAS